MQRLRERTSRRRLGRRLPLIRVADDADRLDRYRDPAAVLRVERVLATGRIDVFEEVRDPVNFWSRDNARTPMQWSDAPNAGADPETFADRRVLDGEPGEMLVVLNFFDGTPSWELPGGIGAVTAVGPGR